MTQIAMSPDDASTHLSSKAADRPRERRPQYPAPVGEDRVAVITGGSSGIGAALARKLVARGWQCVLLARGRERLEKTAIALGAEAERCDIGDRADVERAAAAVRERHQKIKALVNNAGIPGGGGFLELDPGHIERITKVNYLGGVWCLREFLPLLEAGAPSHVVNVASIAATIPLGPSGPYSASKHAQLAFSRNVTAELASRRIQVHSVNPAFTATDGFPHTKMLNGGWKRRIVMPPERVADSIVKAIEHKSAEVYVPAHYRLAGVLHSLAPGSWSRLAARREQSR